MKILIAFVLLLVGACVGLYVGGYLLLVGGVIQVIQSATPVIVAKGVAFGIAKILFSGVVGQICALVFIVPALAMLSTD
jgi:hypothetical protein